MVAALIAALVVLALLQFRWIGQVSEFEHERLRASLMIAVRNFRQDFTEELLRLGFAFRGEPAHSYVGALSTYAERWDQWRRSEPQNRLLDGVYFWPAELSGRLPLLRFDPETHRFLPASPPTAWKELRDKLLLAADAQADVSLWEVPRLPWVLEESVPALVSPVFQVDPQREGESDAPALLLGHLVLVLNRAVIEKEILPNLAKRYFSGVAGWDYHVAVVSGSGMSRSLYQSNRAAAHAAFTSADAAVSLLDQPEVHPGSRRAPPRLIVPGSDATEWKLVVRHRTGSLDTVVAGLRRRNLAITATVLLLLAGSMTLILVSVRRAQALAQMQMDFVAGVSHELRTPLAVMISAADNLAHGVVDPLKHAARYGTLIGNEGRRLSTMIEEVLSFASGKRGPRHYDIQPMSVTGIVSEVLTGASSLLKAGAFTVEWTPPTSMPLVRADAAALRQVLDNLVGNAIKYGVDGRWLGVSVAEENNPEPRVNMTVADRGPGISPDELPHIFKPFYRGRAVRGTHIRGVGLGLNLAKEMVEGMGGSLTVESTLGRGSRFTVSLPAASQSVAAETPASVQTI